jgi:hypothetical protein
MNPSRLIAAAIVVAAGLGFYLYDVLGSDVCASESTTQSVLALLQQNGRINFIDGDWVGETAVSQFVHLAMTGAAAPSGFGYRCRGTILVDYNPNYVRLLLGEKDKPYTGSEPLHREFAIDYTPTRTGFEQDVRIEYNLAPR